MKTKQAILEKIVSSIKMRFDCDPVIENNAIRIEAGNLSLSDMANLQRYCQNRAYELEVTSEVTFKITL